MISASFKMTNSNDKSRKRHVHVHMCDPFLRFDFNR